jgi:predicted nucleotidyltransferase
MTTIIRHGIKNILNIFYKNRTQKIHLRGLARETKLYGQSITRYLTQLEKEGILKSETEGNLKKYFLQKNDKVYSLLNFLDIEKFEMLPSIKKQAILIFLERLNKKPVITFLFGSTAKKTYKAESDIDLLLIVNNKLNVKEALDYANSQTGETISVFQVSYNNFKNELKMKDDKVLESALETGYPITNHIQYYRCINEKI